MTKEQEIAEAKDKVIEAAKRWNPTVRGAMRHLIPEAQALVDAIARLEATEKRS